MQHELQPDSLVDLKFIMADTGFGKTLVWEKRQNEMLGQGKIRYRTWPLLPVVMDG